MPGDLPFDNPCPPDFARRIITIDISTLQIGEPLAIVDDTASQRSSFRMRMFQRRFGERRRPQFAVCVEDVTAFIHAPAKVIARLDKINLLPQILTVVTNPNIACFGINGHPPRVSHSNRIRFRSNVFLSDKRIVIRDTVRPVIVGMVDINAEHFGQQMIHPLPGQIGVRIARAIAACDVQHSVKAEGRSCSVVPV